MRTATVERATKETSVSVTVNLDGEGIYDVDTGIGFLDHMMEQLSRHSLVDITLRAKGDTHVDFHHTTEDVGIVVGQAIAKALGDLRGMRAATERLKSEIGACIVLEGMGVGRIVHRALGSRRYRISVRAPGGHSWSDFGTPSAIHAIAAIAMDLVRLQPPSSPMPIAERSRAN